MSLPVKQNSLVPLCYLSPFKNIALFVRARVYDPANTLLATKNLTHIEEGRYTDATFFMPSVDSLKVRYDIYTDAGYSVANEDEGSIDERFHLLETLDALIRNDELELIFDDDDSDMFLTFGDDETEIIMTAEDSDFVTEFGDDDTTLSFEDDNDDFSIELNDC